MQSQVGYAVDTPNQTQPPLLVSRGNCLARLFSSRLGRFRWVCIVCVCVEVLSPPLPEGLLLRTDMPCFVKINIISGGSAGIHGINLLLRVLLSGCWCRRLKIEPMFVLRLFFATSVPVWVSVWVWLWRFQWCLLSSGLEDRTFFFFFLFFFCWPHLPSWRVRTWKEWTFLIRTLFAECLLSFSTGRGKLIPVDAGYNLISESRCLFVYLADEKQC